MMTEISAFESRLFSALDGYTPPADLVQPAAFQKEIFSEQAEPKHETQILLRGRALYSTEPEGGRTGLGDSYNFRVIANIELSLFRYEASRPDFIKVFEHLLEWSLTALKNSGIEIISDTAENGKEFLTLTLSHWIDLNIRRQ